MYKKALKYLTDHPYYNSTIHMLIGLGIGILITYPYIVNPVRIGGTLLFLGLLGHIYPFFAKK